VELGARCLDANIPVVDFGEMSETCAPVATRSGPVRSAKYR
jgi:hypothetical protein